jgi:hypothetical protein
MKLHEQRNEYLNALRAVYDEVHAARCSILRKIASPYGDGSRSNMINAETDILPRLEWILQNLPAEAWPDDCRF